MAMTDTKQLTRLIMIGSGLVFAICIWLLVLAIWGYGHLTIHAPAGSIITINGHTVTETNNLRLRPGTYNVSIVSAKYFSSYRAVSVSPFRTTSYTPPLDERSADSIASAALGGVDSFGSPHASSPQWFKDSTWAVMVIGPSSSDFIAAQYDKGSWVLRYRASTPGDTSSIPPEVLSAVKNLESGLGG